MKINRVFLSAALGLSLAACGTPAEEVQTAADVPQAEVSETTSEQTETELTTTFEETTTTTVETTTTVTETEKVCTCESEFQHACCEYLNGMKELGGGVYYEDINGDEKPEAVISKWTSDKDTIILYSKENELGELHLEPNPNWAYVDYITDTKQILFCPFYGHTTGTWGYEEYYLYSWNGKDYEVMSSILRESGYMYESYNGEQFVGYVNTYGQAYIDGEEVDNDTFEVKLAEFEKLRDENDYFPIVKPDDENFESYMKENFPCFDNWDIVYYDD